MNPTQFTSLAEFGVLRFSGPDARAFLQGQISNDVAALRPDAPLLAGLHTPQGRVIALLWLFAAGAEDVLVALPLSLLPGVAAQLRRFVLRSRLSIEDASADWRVYGVTDGSSRELRLRDAQAPAPEGTRIEMAQWLAEDIAHGIPSVTPATSGLFVSQMLNLDVLQAISFTKGCYTGQEIIARAHYRGRVKRRMQRFITSSTASLQIGARVLLPDGRLAEVISTAPRPQGGQDLLAVAPLPRVLAEEPPATETIADAPRLEAVSAPLPYALPE